MSRDGDQGVAVAENRKIEKLTVFFAFGVMISHSDGQRLGTNHSTRPTDLSIMFDAMAL